MRRCLILTGRRASLSLQLALGEDDVPSQHFVPHIFFGLNPMMVSTVILCITYGVIIWDKLNRAIVALLGASVMIFVGALDQDEAVKGIDWNTIGLLTGMMILVSISRRSGMFEYLAIWSAQKAKASPAGILVLLQITTAVVSALLDNVTTVLLVVPVTLAITSELDVPPYPFLFAEVFASNIGGTATLIGDPPNILIGSLVGLDFNAFLIHLAPVIVVIMAAPGTDDPCALGKSAKIDAGAPRTGDGDERGRGHR
jgi:Na+/H+ antiporter NhaD/arsenite permease-like protein